MTNIRINFTRLQTLGDDLFDNHSEGQGKHYYAIKNIIIQGSCSCFGHSSRCLPLDNSFSVPEMVHGRCECTHNTKGKNCEKCEDFFNDLPWKPAVGKQTNACRKCNCNEHSTSCHFDRAVYEKSGRVSGGVCDACQHNTMGKNCELCKPSYFRDPSKNITDPDACQLLAYTCDPKGSLNEETRARNCVCKSNVEGILCDRCKSGYSYLDSNNPEGCQPNFQFNHNPEEEERGQVTGKEFILEGVNEEELKDRKNYEYEGEWNQEEDMEIN